MKSPKDNTAIDPERSSMNWLLTSGILNRVHWALHYGYSPLRKKLGPLYTEATGYGIKWLLNCSYWLRDDAFLYYSKKLGGFVDSSKISLNSKYSTFRSSFWPRTGSWDSKAYSFDTAVCVSALIDIGQLTNDSRFLEDAMSCGYWLVEEMQNSDGSFKSCMDTNSGRFVEIDSWFGDRGCLHAKIAISLYKLYELTCDPLFIEAFDSLLGWLLSLQQASGGISAREGVGYVFTHSHCYALEALAYAYEKTKEEKYFVAFKKGVDWLIQMQDKDGGFFDFYGLAKPILWKRIDATAQACRLFIGMFLLEPNEIYILAAKKVANFLVNNQVIGSNDKRIEGGLYTRRLSLFKWPEMNSWTVLFANHCFHLLKFIDEYDFHRFVTELF